MVWPGFHAACDGRIDSEVLLYRTQATVLDCSTALDDAGDRGGPTLGRLLEGVPDQRARCLRRYSDRRNTLIREPFADRVRMRSRSPSVNSRQHPGFDFFVPIRLDGLGEIHLSPREPCSFAPEVRGLAGDRGGNALLVKRQSDTRLRSPPQSQQHRRKQQETAECQSHPSLGQPGCKRDASRDRSDSTKRKR